MGSAAAGGSDDRRIGSTSVPVVLTPKVLPVSSLATILTLGPKGLVYRHQSRTSTTSLRVRPEASNCSLPSDRTSIKSMVRLSSPASIEIPDATQYPFDSRRRHPPRHRRCRLEGSDPKNQGGSSDGSACGQKMGGCHAARIS